MPRKSGYDVRGEFLTLQLFTKVGEIATPMEINKHVGRGDYAAKYISFLRNRHGYSFDVTKDGRTVVSYTLTGVPKNDEEVRSKATQVKQPKTKPAKAATKSAKAPKAAAPKKASKSAMTKEEIKKAASALMAKRKPKDEVEETFGSSGAIASSYSVDPDWDSAENLDVRSLVA